MSYENSLFPKSTVYVPRLQSTLSGQKYSYTAKYPCTDCAVYRLKNQLGTKMGIEICRDQKFIVLAFTVEKIFDFLTFHGVLIY